MLNLKHRWQQSVAALSLAALTSACSTVDVRTTSVCGDKCFAALKTEQQITVVRALNDRAADFRRAGDVGNTRAMELMLTRYIEQIDPAAAKAAGLTRAQLGLENAAESGKTIRATVLDVCPDNKPGTCAAITPVPGK